MTNRDFTKTKRSKYTVQYMKDWITASRDHYNAWKDKQNADEIARILSGGKWHDVVIPDTDEAGEPVPWWKDRILVNLHMRVKNRMSSLVGDTKPENRFTRDVEGAERVGEVIDRGVMREMQRMGAPEENSEGVGSVYSYGSAWYWLEIPNLPMLGELGPASAGADQKTRSAAVGAARTSRFQDHEQEATAASPTPGAIDAVNEEQGLRPDIENQRRAAQEQAEAKDEEEKGVPIYWRGDKMRARLTRVTYGNDLVVGPINRVSRFRDCQFVARSFYMPLDEAKKHPSFRPAAAKKLTASGVRLRDKHLKTTTPTRPDPIQNEEDGDGGEVHIHIIFDRKWKTMHMIADKCEEFLEVSEDYPYAVDGRSIFPEIGEHPGFFPCIPATVMRIPDDEPEKIYGIPAGDPAHDLQKAYVKECSWIHQGVKRAMSGAMASHGITEDERNALMAGEPVVVDLSDPNAKLEPAAPKAPSRDSIAWVEALLQKWAMSAPYSMTRLQGQAPEETLGQTNLAAAGTDEAMFEFLRQLEKAYSYQALFVFQIMRHYYPPEVFDEILGPVDAAVFRMAIGRPTREDEEAARVGSETYDMRVEAAVGFRIVEELPDTTFARSSRERGNFARIKQGLDTVDRGQGLISPLTGAPIKDVVGLFDEVTKMQGFGRLPDFQLSAEDRLALTQAKRLEAREAAAKAAGQQNGGTSRPHRDTEQRTDSNGLAEEPASDSDIQATANAVDTV